MLKIFPKALYLRATPLRAGAAKNMNGAIFENNVAFHNAFLPTNILPMGIGALSVARGRAQGGSILK